MTLTRNTDRSEFFAAVVKSVMAFSELNDAEDQAQRSPDQAAAKDAGDDEAMFCTMKITSRTEHGLPPTAGLGIGIDRTVAVQQQPYHPRRYSVPRRCW